MGDTVYKSFQDLDVWQVSRQYKLEIYKLVDGFPKEEKYRLTDQLIRSARSIPANIAEGYGRFTYKDQIHFCIQARGSLYESYNHIIDAFDCNYIAESVKDEYKLKISDVEKLLNGYIAWLRKMLNQSK